MNRLFQYFKDYPALSLACLTAYLYLCTYEYEVGYLQEFNISNNYLILDVTTILKDSSHVIVLAFTVLSGEQFLFMIFQKPIQKRSTFGRVVKYLIRLAVVLVFMWMATSITGQTLLYILLCVFGIFFLFFIWLIITTAIEKSKNIPPAPETNLPNEDSQNSTIWFNKYFGIVFGVCYPFIICSFFGSGEASKEDSFQVLTDNNIEYVVIRKYGDELICKDLSKTNLVGAKTFIIKLSAEKPLVVTEKKLGQIGNSRSVSN
ncbi:MAG TPA: hypothetical protein VK671_04600 [Mucilaginibacter sp.]|nr:hypothetical protein [Mucilaginibacter sp.]